MGSKIKRPPTCTTSEQHLLGRWNSLFMRMSWNLMRMGWIVEIFLFLDKIPHLFGCLFAHCCRMTTWKVPPSVSFRKQSFLPALFSVTFKFLRSSCDSVQFFQDVFLLEPGSVPECLASPPLVLALIGCSWILLGASGIALIPFGSWEICFCFRPARLWECHPVYLNLLQSKRLRRLMHRKCVSVQRGILRCTMKWPQKSNGLIYPATQITENVLNQWMVLSAH